MYILMMFPALSFLKTEGATPEEALAKMQDIMKVDLITHPRLTYRPADGTVYIDMDHIPRGVVFRAPDTNPAPLKQAARDYLRELEGDGPLAKVEAAKEALLSIAILWAQADSIAKIEKRPREYLKRITRHAEVMTVMEWAKQVANGRITELDGIGRWAKDGKEHSDEVFETSQEDATHVAWYPNK